MAIADQQIVTAPSILASWGEVFDKITILEIKVARLSGSPQASVARDLRNLKLIADKVAQHQEIGALKSQLFASNAELWEIEDRLRAKEASSTFDSEFVALARSVYKTNDLRARIKRQIDVRLNSAISEEKIYTTKYGHEGEWSGSRKKQRWTGDDPSEFGEGKLIASLLEAHAHEPFLVDVGAHDGTSGSNSLPLIQAGWRALCVEPSPGPFKRLSCLHAGRAGVQCLPLACANRTGEADLFFGSDGADCSGMSTLCRDENEWFSYARSDQSISVEVDTLTNILLENNAPHSFGLLLVDAEGMDYEVLLGLDFAMYRPLLVVTEEYEWNRAKHAAKYSLLIEKQYSLVQKIGCNIIWLDMVARRHEAKA